MLTILSCEESVRSDQALSEFARFLGPTAEIVPLVGDFSEPPPPFRQFRPGHSVLAMHRQTLRKVFRRDWLARALEEARFVFVYGFAASAEESPELKWLTDGAFGSVVDTGAVENRFTVHEGVKYGSFPVAGKSYLAGSGGPGSAAAFLGPNGATVAQTYITVNGRPHFVGINRGSSVRFLLAEPELAGIDGPLAPERTLRPWYAQLIAATIFLRSAFEDRCWTSPVTGATLMIDDPHLKARYGFVHYRKLLPELENIRGALTVAFIPYNYRRSDPGTIEWVRRFPHRFSISVHGCDHISGEYAGRDDRWLMGLTARALARMESHASRTSMPFDNVMAFPNGRFSTGALRALSACGIAAAVNSAPWLVDGGESHLTLRDHLDVAVTRYECFPIFTRRYPQDIFDYAFDALFQKPIVAVEHHAYFRDGYQALAKLVREVTALSPKVKWMPLGETLAAGYLLKQNGRGQSTLRHFMPTVRFQNPTSDDLSLAMEKPEEEGRVEAVVAGGREVPFEIRAQKLTYQVQLRPGEEANVTIRYRPAQRPSQKTSWKYRFGVRVRRILSEVRDNHLARNERLLAVAIKTKNSLAKARRRGRAR